MLDKKISGLREKLIAQANVVEEMIAQCLRGLEKSDRERLMEAVDKNEQTVNMMEIEIDELCINILALHHPEAKDLRTTLMISKMTSDLERMGDCAVNIAESAVSFSGPQPEPFRSELIELAVETARMVRDGIASFINGDPALAREVCRRDKAVDALRDKIWNELSRAALIDRTNIETELHILRIANNFEKIADISTNIAEETVFVASGSVIKHHQGERPGAGGGEPSFDSRC